MAANTKTVAEDMADKIDAAGHGTTETDIFVDFEPGKPPATVMTIVYNSPGQDPDATGKTFERPTFQIIVVGPVDDPVAAQVQAQKIKELFHTIQPFATAAGTRYRGVWQQGSGPFPLGDDKRGRPQYSLNFRTHRAYT